MKCLEVQEQLSAYHDGELAAEIRSQVAAHIASCDECAQQLAEFESYSQTFKELSQPEVPSSVWAGIVREVGDSVQPAARGPWSKHRERSWLTAGRLALAASVLLVLGLGYWMTQPSGHSDSHHAEFAMTMDRYLRILASDPAEAEQFLLNKYDGQTVDPEDAIQLVGYRPAVASGLPEKYTLASTSVMKMPCCTCVKAVCKRQDGSTLVLFEHDDEETQWFGDRTSSTATCSDTDCCLVDLDSSIAATWKRGSRWVTAVGVLDTAEVSELVTWLENKTSSESQPL